MVKRAFFVMPAFGLGLAALVGCSTAEPVAAPAPIATSTSSSSAAPTSPSAPAETPQAIMEKPQPIVEKKPDCAVNPADLPVPSAEPFAFLPAQYAVQVKIAGAPKVVKVGKTVEVEVTLCNNSPVAHPEVGLVFGIERCSCAEGPLHLSRGTAQRFDAASGSWVALPHPAMGTGMDYLTEFTDRQPFPKGKKVTVRYRFTLDRSMGEGDGGITAVAVMPQVPATISTARAPFAVKR